MTMCEACTDYVATGATAGPAPRTVDPGVAAAEQELIRAMQEAAAENAKEAVEASIMNLEVARIIEHNINIPPASADQDPVSVRISDPGQHIQVLPDTFLHHELAIYYEAEVAIRPPLTPKTTITWFSLAVEFIGAILVVRATPAELSPQNPAATPLTINVLEVWAKTDVIRELRRGGQRQPLAVRQFAERMLWNVVDAARRAGRDMPRWVREGREALVARMEERREYYQGMRRENEEVRVREERRMRGEGQ